MSECQRAEALLWVRAYQSHPVALALADRHYSRATPGSHTMMPVGRRLVLVTAAGDAVWGASWPLPQVTRRDWFPGAWFVTIFRNEGPLLSSLLIRQAVAATRAVWGEPPADGMITVVDPDRIRRKRDPGRCFLRAGFTPDGHTKERGLPILRLAPEDMPESWPPLGYQHRLEDVG